MAFTWYNILLLCVAGVFCLFAVLSIGGDETDTFLFCGFVTLFCVGLAFFLTYVHAQGHRDSAAKAQLKAQGYDVADTNTSSHQVTLNIGACQRTLDIRRRDGRWRVFIASGHFRQELFTPADAKKFGKACT